MYILYCTNFLLDTLEVTFYPMVIVNHSFVNGRQAIRGRLHTDVSHCCHMVWPDTREKMTTATHCTVWALHLNWLYFQSIFICQLIIMSGFLLHVHVRKLGLCNIELPVDGACAMVMMTAKLWRLQNPAAESFVVCSCNQPEHPIII